MVDFSSVHVTHVDREARMLTAAKVRNQVKQFMTLLNSNSPETKVQDFLASHSYFFSGVIDLYGPSPLYSKIKLGSEYVADFAWFDINTLGPEWNLVEIEPPGERLFNAKGDPSAFLTHALQQIKNWQRWIQTNGDYARKLLPNVLYPLGHLYMGRRKELSSKNQETLRQLAHENRMTSRIHTLDWFATAGLQIAEHLSSKTTGGKWTVPVKALTHKDLANGLTGDAKESMNHEYAKTAARLSLEERLKVRERDYLDFG